METSTNLVGGDGNKVGIRKEEDLRRRPGNLTGLGCPDDVQPWTVLVHAGEYDLQWKEGSSGLVTVLRGA